MTTSIAARDDALRTRGRRYLLGLLAALLVGVGVGLVFAWVVF